MIWCVVGDKYRRSHQKSITIKNYNFYIQLYQNLQEYEIKISGYKVYQPNSDDLIIEKSWKDSLFPFILIFTFFLLWYWGLLSSSNYSEYDLITRIYKIISNEPFIIIFFIAPIIIILPILFKLSSKIFKHKQYLIDGKHGIIMKNDKLITSFANITNLALIHQGSELIIEINDKERISLLKSRNHSGIKKIANITSQLIKIPIDIL